MSAFGTKRTCQSLSAIWLANRAFEIVVVPAKAERAMKPSNIEPGFYYEKRNVPGWLRFVVAIDKHQVVYADFIDYGQCRVESLGRWANNQRYTAEKAAERFPKEVADISKVLEGLPMATDSDYSPSRCSSPHDDRQYRQAAGASLKR
jgi:hypothetical protein